MPFPRPVRTACLAASVLLFAACGGDSTGNSGDGVSPAEAAALMQSLFGFVGDNLNLFMVPASLAQVPYSDTYDPLIDADEDCEAGGTRTLDGTISGDVDEQAQTADLNVMARADFVGCRFYISELNIITVDGQPDVLFDADLLIDEAQDNETDVVDVSGTVAFSITDGRSGTCVIDALVTITSIGTSEEVTASGSVCGANAAGLVFFD
jgi:hypothetical protein